MEVPPATHVSCPRLRPPLYGPQGGATLARPISYPYNLLTRILYALTLDRGYPTNLDGQISDSKGFSVIRLTVISLISIFGGSRVCPSLFPTEKGGWLGN
jgi:hypothetical protein